jgi:hypothetical protein
MSFKNKSTKNKLKQLSTLGPNLFAGKFFDLLHDSAENICPQNSVHDTLPGSDPGLTVHNLSIFLLLGTKPQLSW